MADQGQADAQAQSRYGNTITYDPNWKGPISADERNKTDFKLFLFFLIYLFIWGLMGIHAILKVREEDIGTLEGTDALSTLSNIRDLWYQQAYSNLRAKMLLIVLFCAILTVLISIGMIFILYFWAKIVAWTIAVSICLFFFYEAFMDLAICFKAIRVDHPILTDFSFIVFFSVGVFIAVTMIATHFWKKINIVAEVVGEGSKAAIYFYPVFAIPIIESILNLLLAIFWGSVAGALTMAVYLEPETSAFRFYLFQLFNLFGFVWSINFIHGAGQIIKSGSFAVWYWTMDKELIPKETVTNSCISTIRFHLGTAALGAMLLTIIQGIKALIDVTKRIFEGEGYYSANFGIECCQDIFHVLVFVLQYANNYAYIICSVHGTDFFRSARHVYNLIMKNVILTLASAMLATLVVFFCQLIIVLTISWISYRLIKDDNDELATSVVVTSAVLLATTICRAFFSVLNTAIDTVFLCVLEDLERNDGSSSRPYLMSEKIKMMLNS